MSIKNKTLRSSFVCYFIMIALFAVLRMLSSFGCFSFLGKTFGNYIFTFVVQILLLFGVAVFLFASMMKRKPKEVLHFYGYKKISWKAVVYAILLGVVVYFLNIYIASVFSSILQAIGYKPISSGETLTSYPIWLLLVNLLFTAVLPGICEETVHRGMLLKGTSSIGYVKAVVISGLLFGLMHMNIEQFFYATAIGMLLGYVAVLCGNIWPCVIIHFMNNALNVYSGFSNHHNMLFGNMFEGVNNFIKSSPVLAMFVMFLALVLLVILAFWLLKKLFKETTGKKFKLLQEEVYKDIIKNDYIENLTSIKAVVNGEESAEAEGKDEEAEKVETFSRTPTEIVAEKNVSLGIMSPLDRELMYDDSKPKKDPITLTLMIASFVIGIGVTLFTLIWGLI